MESEAYIVDKKDEEEGEVKAETASDSPKGIDLDRLGKVIAATTAVMYVVGLLTVNTYLHRLGVSEFSLFKAKYIYTGALVLIPIVISTLAPLYGIFIVIENASEEIKIDPASRISVAVADFMRSSLFRWFILIIMASMPYFIFIAVLIPFRVEYKFWQILFFYFISAATGGVALGIGALILYGPASKQRPANRIIVADGEAGKAKARRGIPLALGVFACSLFFVGYFGWYLGLFTQYAYPVIPEQFGGGRPKEARLLFKSDSVNAARELGVEIAPEHFLSAQVKILFENDETYVLLLPNQHVVRVNKDMISGIEVATLGLLDNELTTP